MTIYPEKSGFLILKHPDYSRFLTIYPDYSWFIAILLDWFPIHLDLSPLFPIYRDYFLFILIIPDFSRCFLMFHVIILSLSISNIILSALRR